MQDQAVSAIYFQDLTMLPLKIRTGNTGLISALVPAATAIVAALLLPYNAHSADLTPFTVKYDVKVSAAKADMELSLAADSSGGYSIDSKTEAKGAAKVVMSGAAREHAEFEIVDGAIRASSYEVD